MQTLSQLGLTQVSAPTDSSSLQQTDHQADNSAGGNNDGDAFDQPYRRAKAV